MGTQQQSWDEPLLQSSGFLIAMLGQESQRRYMAFVRQWGIGEPHQGVLNALLGLGATQAVSQKELSELTGIDPRNIVAVLDALEAQKLIQRVAHATDRRKYNITLTNQGKTLARQLQKTAAELERGMFATLTQTEQATLHALLLKLYKGLK